MDAETFLGAFPSFRGSGRELVNELLASGRQQSVGSGTQIYAEGDSCGAIAFVLNGEIRVYKIGTTGREITLYEVGRGETCILNASCVLGGQSYPANALTLSDVDVLLVPSETFRRLVAADETIRRFVFRLLSDRLAGVMELVEEVAFGRMDERLQEYLLEKSENGRLDSTHQVIANDIGTSREVVSRILKDFERQGKVAISRSTIGIIKL